LLVHRCCLFDIGNPRHIPEVDLFDITYVDR
jgi:hypothetical protein